MLAGYIPILVMMIVAAVIALGMVGASFLLGPKKPSKQKQSPYECGIIPVGSARERFPVKFYLIAMLFIVFDIETVFLYPWAVTFTRWNSHAMQVFSLFEMIVFIIILFVGYIYVWQKGAFDWE